MEASKGILNDLNSELEAFRIVDERVKGQGNNKSVLFRDVSILRMRSRLCSSNRHLLFAHVSRARRTFELDRYIGIAISSVVVVPVSYFFNKVTSQGSTHERAAAEIIPHSAFLRSLSARSLMYPLA